jgi:hypothetical protein
MAATRLRRRVRLASTTAPAAVRDTSALCTSNRPASTRSLDALNSRTMDRTSGMIGTSSTQSWTHVTSSSSARRSVADVTV